MRLVGWLALSWVILVSSGVLCAQPPGGASGDNSTPAPGPASGARQTPLAAKKAGRVRPALAITPEREAAVLSFVERNHFELAELLGYLKASQPEDYDRAVREIFRTTERLAQVQERDAMQYELEVAAWTAQSRVQLLAAKSMMGASDDLNRQLRQALRTQNEAKLALLKHDRQKLSDRLNKIDADIVHFESDRDNVIERQLKLLSRSAVEGRTGKLGGKGAAKQAKKIVPPAAKP